MPGVTSVPVNKKGVLYLIIWCHLFKGLGYSRSVLGCGVGGWGAVRLRGLKVNLGLKICAWYLRCRVGGFALVVCRAVKVRRYSRNQEPPKYPLR